MITLGQLPILGRIAAKIDLAAMGAVLRNKDLLPDDVDVMDMKSDQQAAVIFEVVSVVVPKLEDIAGDLTRLIAVGKEISVEEAAKLGAFEAIKDLLEQDGILDFFIRRLKAKKEPKVLDFSRDTTSS